MPHQEIVVRGIKKLRAFGKEAYVFLTSNLSFDSTIAIGGFERRETGHARSSCGFLWDLVAELPWAAYRRRGRILGGAT